MADSIREQILQALVAKGQTITAANGYTVDLASTDVRRAVRAVDVSPGGEALTIWDGDEIVEYQAGGVVKRTMPVTVEYLRDLTGTAETGYSALAQVAKADIEKAFTASSTTLGGLCHATQCTGVSPAYPDENSQTLGATVRLTVIYETTKGDPFSSP